MPPKLSSPRSSSTGQRISAKREGISSPSSQAAPPSAASGAAAKCDYPVKIADYAWVGYEADRRATPGVHGGLGQGQQVVAIEGDGARAGRRE